MHQRRNFLRLLLALVALVPFWFNPTQADAATSGRVIVANIAQQRVYAYQNGRLLFAFHANMAGTARGTFRVQTKLPVAGSFVLGWRLPYWLGIYYAGNLENGFHGVAYTRGGGRTDRSLGCIVMSDANALRLYRWASVGTRVVIQ